MDNTTDKLDKIAAGKLRHSSDSHRGTMTVPRRLLKSASAIGNPPTGRSWPRFPRRHPSPVRQVGKPLYQKRYRPRVPIGVDFRGCFKPCIKRSIVDTVQAEE